MALRAYIMLRLLTNPCTVPSLIVLIGAGQHYQGAWYSWQAEDHGFT